MKFAHNRRIRKGGAALVAAMLCAGSMLVVGATSASAAVTTCAGRIGNKDGRFHYSDNLVVELVPES